jgi:hypothetical protein
MSYPHFTEDNTEGYSVDDIERLNELMAEIIITWQIVEDPEFGDSTDLKWAREQAEKSLELEKRTAP